MTARTTLVLLALALALTACGQAESPPADAPTASHEAPTPAPEPVTVSTEEALEIVLAEVAPPADEVEILDEPSEAPLPTYAEFSLRHGESLDHFARWSGLPVEVVAEASGLDLSGAYVAGTPIRVPVEGEARSTLESSRDRHHTKRAEGYLASRGGTLGNEFVTVKTGDSAWSIARDQQGIPIWLLETYNPSVELDRLRPGQQLMVPVIADIVVDAEDL